MGSSQGRSINSTAACPDESSGWNIQKSGMTPPEIPRGITDDAPLEVSGKKISDFLGNCLHGYCLICKEAITDVRCCSLDQLFGRHDVPADSVVVNIL